MHVTIPSGFILALKLSECRFTVINDGVINKVNFMFQFLTSLGSVTSFETSVLRTKNNVHDCLFWHDVCDTLLRTMGTCHMNMMRVT